MSHFSSRTGVNLLSRWQDSSTTSLSSFRAIAMALVATLVFSMFLALETAAPAIADDTAEHMGVEATVLDNMAAAKTRQAIPYNVVASELKEASGGTLTATLTNAQWAAPAVSNTQIYCQAYGGVFSLSQNNTVWSCSGLVFSATQSSVTFTPRAFAPESSHGKSVGLSVVFTTSLGTVSKTATTVAVSAVQTDFSIAPTAAVSTGSARNQINLSGSLLTTNMNGTLPPPATQGVVFTMLPPVGAQSCTNASDSYGGPSCSPVTSIPYVPTGNTSLVYAPTVTEANFDTVAPFPIRRESSQPEGIGTPVTLKGTIGDTLYPSRTNGGNITANFTHTDGLVNETLSVDVVWLASLRYADGTPSGAYNCRWTAATVDASVPLNVSSGSCGRMEASSQEALVVSTAAGAGSVNGVVRTFANSLYPNAFSSSAGPNGTVPAPIGMAQCLKFDNTRDQLVSAVGTNQTFSYGSGPWGTNAPDLARSTYELRDASCYQNDSVAHWYSAAQVDFTNSGAAGTLINANQINVVRQTSAAVLAAGQRITMTLGPNLMALATDTRGQQIAPGEVHLFSTQVVSSTGVIFNKTQCAGADDVNRLCPLPSGPAPIPGVLHGKQGSGPMSVDYMLNNSAARGTNVGYTGVFEGGGVTGQLLNFTINARGTTTQTATRNPNYGAVVSAKTPANVSTPNVTVLSVLPRGVNVDCDSVQPGPASCSFTGAGDTVQYTIEWHLASLARDEIKRLTVPGSLDSLTPSGTMDIRTTIKAPGQEPQVDDTSILRFTAVKQNQPSVLKTTSTPALVQGDRDGDWTLTMSTPSTVAIDKMNAFDILPFDGDARQSVVKGRYSLKSIDASTAPGATVYVSSADPSILDALDGKVDGTVNPQTSTALANEEAIADAFQCTLAQVGSAGCPALKDITALNIRGGAGFLPAGSSKSIKLNVDTSELVRGDTLRNNFTAQYGFYVTSFSARVPIAIADPAFTVEHTVSPATEIGPGGTGTYKVTVKNTGNVALPYRTLTPTITVDLSGLLDDTGAPTNIKPAGGITSISGTNLNWTPAVIAAGESAVLTFDVKVNSPTTGDLSLRTKVSAPTNTFAEVPTGLDCPAGSTATRCSTNTPVAQVPVFTTGAPTTTVRNGAPYSFTVKATGFTAPTFALATPNTLPTGLSLNSTTGVISGTPTVNGVYRFSVVATNSSAASPTKSPEYVITVGTVPAVTAVSSPAGTVDVPYLFTATASGFPAPSFSLISGTLPDGLSLNADTGAISGTPTVPGSFTYGVRASNALGNSATRSFTTVIASVPVITSADPTTPATVGVPYSFAVTATGSPQPLFSRVTGDLPPGLFISNAGLISGTPTTPGRYVFTIGASNGAATSASAGYVIDVASVPVITSSAPPSATTGTAYSFRVVATGQPAPSFSITDGALPTGLALNVSTGVIAGVPTQSGAFTYTVSASNTANASASAEYTTVVSTTPGLTSGSPTSPATVGSSYSFRFTATGDPVPTFSVDGTLPAGLTLNPNTGVLSGPPTEAGTYQFTIKANNGVGDEAQGTYTILVASNPEITSDAPLSPATVGAEYSYTVSAAGSPTPTLSIAGGSLPDGLSINADGLISGVPKTAGSSTFRIQAENGSEVPATAEYTINVYVAPELSSGAPTSPVVVDSSYSFTMTATGSPAPTFTVVEGALPDGLTLASDSGLITGTPAESGSFDFTVRASNGAAIFDQEAYSIVVASVPSITSDHPTSPVLLNSDYSFSVTADGFPAPEFLVSEGALPPGLVLDAESGVIHGNPTEVGSFEYSITASNGAATSVPERYTLVVGSIPVITSDLPPTPVTVGAAYSFTLTASGFPAPTFSVTGDLPTGLTLDPTTGVISGSPTLADTYDFAVTASNAVAQSDEVAYNMVVVSIPEITSEAPTSPVLNEEYSFTVTATGSPAPTFSVVSGGLPTGLALDSDTGVISGVATAQGTFTYTVTASNGAGTVASREYTTAVSVPPTITSPDPDGPATVGEDYSFTVEATGSPSPSFSIPVGTLPQGLTLNATTGVISGAPTEAGTFVFEVAADNGVGSADQREYALRVTSTPVITSESPTSPATVGQSYSFQVVASGSPAPTFSISAGDLPEGLQLDTETGRIFGTPTENGTRSFTVRAENGSPSFAEESYVLDIGTRPVITSAEPPTATVDDAYSFTLEATGDPDPSFEVTKGELPTGLSLNSATGVLAGTPTESGVFTYTVVASNSSGSSVAQEYSTVVATVPAITSEEPTSPATVGIPYSFTVTASGSPQPVFALTTGDLPPGLMVSITGEILGTPTTPGTYSFVISAANGANVSAMGSYTIEVATIPVITSTTPPSAVLGTPYVYTVTASGQPAPTFTVADGELPTGLTLDSVTGEISGIPTVAGSFTYVVNALNTASAFATVTYTTVVSSVPGLTSGEPTSPATVGTLYEFRFEASGDPAPSFEITAGSLPDGLSLDSLTGIVAGTPLTPGSFPFTVTATNGVGTAESSYTLNVVSNPIITSPAPNSPGTVGVAYEFAVTASGDPAPTFRVLDGELPAGLTLSGNGLISGVPSATGTSQFTIEAANGSSVSATEAYSIEVYSVPTITSGSPTSPATVDVGYSFTITVSGFPSPVFSIAEGALPPGLQLDQESGIISGDPTEAGVFDFRVEASNGAAQSAAETYQITVASIPKITSDLPGSPATAGVAYTHTFTASGSPVPTFSLAGGVLPTGLTLNGLTGVLDGTPTAPGLFEFTITAANGAAETATVDYVIHVFEAPVITSSEPASILTVDRDYTFTVVSTGQPKPTFAVTEGALPPGLAIDGVTGVISGKTKEAGTFGYTITASNGAAYEASLSYTTLVASVPQITSGAPAEIVTADEAFSFGFTADGFPSPTFKVKDGSLPQGLILDEATGLLSGHPTKLGTVTFTIEARNAADTSAEASYTITTVSIPAFGKSVPTRANLRQLYAFTLEVTGSPRPTFEIIGGTLPPGLNLDAQTGLISGTPTVAGTFAFSVRASNGASQAAEATFSLIVAPVATLPEGPTGGQPSTGSPTGGQPSSGSPSEGDGSISAGTSSTQGSTFRPGRIDSQAMPLVTSATAKKVASLLIKPSARQVSAGSSVTFVVTGLGVDGTLIGELSGSVTLATDVTSDTFSLNTIQFIRAGTHLVEATFEGLSASTEIVVTPNFDEPSEKSVKIQLDEANVNVGDVVNVNVTGEDRYGNEYGTFAQRATFVSDRDSDKVAQATDVGADARVTFNEPGTSVITVQALGQTDQVTVTVNDVEQDAVAGVRMWWFLLLLVPLAVFVWWFIRRQRGKKMLVTQSEGNAQP